MKKLITKITRKLTAWAWRQEIETCDGLGKLKALKMDDRKMEVTIESNPDLAYWQAKCFAYLVAEAPNYMEMKFDLVGTYRDKTEWLTVTVVKGGGKTPHQMKLEAEAEAARLRVALKSIAHKEVK